MSIKQKNAILLSAIIIVALVFGSISSTVAYSHITTSTYVSAPIFSSSSYLSVSNMPVISSYESLYIAPLFAPTFPPIDISYNYIDVAGDSYTQEVEVVSTPSGTVDSAIISNPSELTGELSYWNCALWAENIPPLTYALPMPGNVAGHIWDSGHLAGTAGFGTLNMDTSFSWP
jgi:hypothetical protein